MKSFIFFNGINLGIYNIRKCSYKTAIEICKPYKYLNVLNTGWNLPILNAFDLFGVYANAFNKDD